MWKISLIKCIEVAAIIVKYTSYVEKVSLTLVLLIMLINLYYMYYIKREMTDVCEL